MAFTQLYLTANAAPYTPATLRGAWDDTSGAVTMALDVVKDAGGTITSVAKAEINASTTWDVLLYRGVSQPLAAQTISGTIQVLLGILESSATADFNWHVHVYVTQGDSDTPRGTLLTDYVEALGTNEWPTTATGKQLNAAQTLASLAITAGDRLVVEIGYIARNSVTTSFTGTLRYGTLTSTGLVAADLTNGSTAVTTLAGFLTFSNSITEQDTPLRASSTTLQAMTSGQAGLVDSSVTLQAITRGQVALRDSSMTLQALIAKQAQMLASATVLLVMSSNLVPEYVPVIGDSFGALLWYEFDSSDGVTHAWAMLDLPDAPTYYHGMKDGIVLQPGAVVRSLSSDDDGSYEGQQVSVQVSDISRYLRGLLGQTNARRNFVGRLLRLRMIDVAGWRAQQTPRTVAMAVVRDYSTAN